MIPYTGRSIVAFDGKCWHVWRVDAPGAGFDPSTSTQFGTIRDKDAEHKREPRPIQAGAKA